MMCYVSGVIAWTGLLKNSGMLWTSYPIQETLTRQPTMGSWLSWIGPLVVTVLAAGGAIYRVLTAQWHVNKVGRSVRLDEESA
jgi:hypothetical protein